MFWKKSKLPKPTQFVKDEGGLREDFPYPERYCSIYISEKHKEIVFVPMGRIDPWKSRELDSVIVKEWPLNIGELQDCIQTTLDKWKDQVDDIEPGNKLWYSLNNSKAKTQHSFRVDYVHLTLTTDMDRKYGQGEVERITVKASPFDWSEVRYKLVGTNHLMETQIAQLVIDISKACEKIRTN
ncbi:MAG: hypothetical protein HYZ54_08575 [Ignavibacteriae bacterium]|nr:hypothetical protein [Ignavibacteriota bacterium]